MKLSRNPLEICIKMAFYLKMNRLLAEIYLLMKGIRIKTMKI